MPTFDETLKKVLHTFAEAVKSANTSSEQSHETAEESALRVVIAYADIPMTDEERWKTTPPNKDK